MKHLFAFSIALLCSCTPSGKPDPVTLVPAVEAIEQAACNLVPVLAPRSTAVVALVCQAIVPLVNQALEKIPAGAALVQCNPMVAITDGRGHGLGFACGYLAPSVNALVQSDAGK